MFAIFLSASCHCKGSPFKYQYFCYSFSGNLKLVKDSNFRKIISEGPKYREPQNIYCKQARKDMINDIDECIASCFQK